MSLDKLNDFIFTNNIVVEECDKLKHFKKAALFCSINGNNIILLGDDFNSRSKNERLEILAEECGHYATTTGDMTVINNYSDKVKIDKAELKAKQWAAEFLIDFNKFKKACIKCQTLQELIDYLDISYNILNEYVTKLSLREQYFDLGNGYRLNLYRLPNIVKERCDDSETP